MRVADGFEIGQILRFGGNTAVCRYVHKYKHKAGTGLNRGADAPFFNENKHAVRTAQYILILYYIIGKINKYDLKQKGL